MASELSHDPGVIIWYCSKLICWSLAIVMFNFQLACILSDHSSCLHSPLFHFLNSYAPRFRSCAIFYRRICCKFPISDKSIHLLLWNLLPTSFSCYHLYPLVYLSLSPIRLWLRRQGLSFLSCLFLSLSLYGITNI